MARKFVEENPGSSTRCWPPSLNWDRARLGRSRPTWNVRRQDARAHGGDRSETKWIAEALFSSGELTTDKRVGFSRHYQLAHKVIPADIYQREVSDEEAVLELARRAVGALGGGDPRPISVTISDFRPDRSNPRSPRSPTRARWRKWPSTGGVHRHIWLPDGRFREPTGGRHCCAPLIR
ncbi:hypothetical protein L833_5063 [Mycobacteroides abscessus MAB_091912_2446]|uniref:Uncharacterized protein n=1 Tax=Mycobacteroides abscessus MAB_091912_2446 TaxID=1335414 RepID=A0A829M3W8_9MYCO|nr:hypothetical protein L833_5063 [Mycobacteroides abscessus MAB_091912_2446]